MVSFRKAKVLIITMVVAFCVLVSMLVVRDITRGLLLERAHQAGESRLLAYVGDIRRTLARYHFLPYLIAEHSPSLALLQGDSTSLSEVNTYLAQLDKAANTKGWHILDPSGALVASSLSRVALKAQEGQEIANMLYQYGGEVITLSYLAQGEPRYYLGAPIYAKSQLIGIAVARVGLETLTDSWIAANERVLLSDKQQQFFLSSHQNLNVPSLNQPFGWQSSPFILPDGTTTEQVTLEGVIYLVQKVQLDDLQWQIHYLTPLAPLTKTLNWVSFLSVVSVALLLAFGLFLYERRQKIHSKLLLQQLIADSEMRLRRMINKTNVGLLLLNRDGKISDINPMALRYFNLSESLASRLFAWQLFETVHGNTVVVNVLKSLSQHNEAGELNNVEVMAQRSDGSRFPVLFSIISLSRSSEAAFLVTIIDISKRKKAENTLRALNSDLERRVEERTNALQVAQEELVQSSKMAALGRMSSAITHEMNQPLTGIKTLLSSSELLIDRDQTDLLVSNMRLVDTLVDRMAGMTSQLKVFAFDRPEALMPLSIEASLQEVCRIYQPRLEKVTLNVQIASNASWVQGEKQRILQVFGNLVTNALDAMVGVSKPELTITAEMSNEQVVISFSDTGNGIEEDVLPHVFEPFYTTKKMGDGLGLGLAITANNVRDMKGSIRAVNNKAASGDRVEGATFTLVLLDATEAATSKMSPLEKEDIK